MANIEEIISWFRKKYNRNEYFFAFREYKTKSIIKNGLRYKVDGIYQKKFDGMYFIVCKNKPIKEKKEYGKAYSGIDGDVFAEYKVYIR
ncbi:MAG: hypothetical protein EVJ46_06205 [Candidatus Acididesulfobacter guangdongensis]|uniref:Uncharacterized protein n=1 Tax=Acididesulfobacter guangdongensis TaxID=2597225 RepID=A0A519BH47_ACIG2|nr:MAG: hypothetical protein EVJ46_06205 [Candidatus Acididesulfobacter guangdongensis]